MRSHRLIAFLVGMSGPLALIAPLEGQSASPAVKTAPAKAWKAPRTPDGHPDLQGIWTNSTLTPLERPPQFANKPVLSEADAAAFERESLTQGNRDRRDGGADVDVGRAYNELFFEHGKLARLDGSIRTSLIIDPSDGRIPSFTPEAQKRLEATRQQARLHPADGPEDRSLAERCLFWATAGPPMLPGPYNNSYQIYQTPGYVTIFSEMIHESRIIPLDGRGHLPANVRKWTGDSVGHWEGDTLVIDTTNFNDQTRFRGSDANLHIIERLTRVAPDTIAYRFTIDDPSTFSRPWTAELPFLATSSPIYEYACHEGNYALADILKGARAQERPADTRKPSR